ncbi:uncharacterized protein LOC34622647 [Cyclospora cayetanensis]|uniref:non-specific serine/threonine protein kinase n=1 Tax=Cyclospora cayetanensis TaxID=88456 RepID=A0A6P6RUT5_9EIME|nr:uncharacterized protein LOC34622647 [Cyclospora cayetanensis]
MEFAAHASVCGESDAHLRLCRAAAGAASPTGSDAAAALKTLSAMLPFPSAAAFHAALVSRSLVDSLHEQQKQQTESCSSSNSCSCLDCVARQQQQRLLVGFVPPRHALLLLQHLAETATETAAAGGSTATAAATTAAAAATAAQQLLLQLEACAADNKERLSRTAFLCVFRICKPPATESQGGAVLPSEAPPEGDAATSAQGRMPSASARTAFKAAQEALAKDVTLQAFLLFGFGDVAATEHSRISSSNRSSSRHLTSWRCLTVALVESVLQPDLSSLHKASALCGGSTAVCRLLQSLQLHQEVRERRSIRLQRKASQTAGSVSSSSYNSGKQRMQPLDSCHAIGAIVIFAATEALQHPAAAAPYKVLSHFCLEALRLTAAAAAAMRQNGVSAASKRAHDADAKIQAAAAVTAAKALEAAKMLAQEQPLLRKHLAVAFHLVAPARPSMPICNLHLTRQCASHTLSPHAAAAAQEREAFECVAEEKEEEAEQAYQPRQPHEQQHRQPHERQQRQPHERQQSLHAVGLYKAAALLVFVSPSLARMLLPLLLLSVLSSGGDETARKLAAALNQHVFQPLRGAEHEQQEQRQQPSVWKAQRLIAAVCLEAVEFVRRQCCSADRSGGGAAAAAGAAASGGASVCSSSLRFLPQQYRRCLSTFWESFDFESAAAAALVLGRSATAVLFAEQQIIRLYGDTAAPLQQGRLALVAEAQQQQQQQQGSLAAALLPAPPPPLLLLLIRAHAAANAVDAAAAHRCLEAWHAPAVLLEKAEVCGDALDSLSLINVQRETALVQQLSTPCQVSLRTETLGKALPPALSAETAAAIPQALTRLGLHGLLSDFLEKGNSLPLPMLLSAACAQATVSTGTSAWMQHKAACLWRLRLWKDALQSAPATGAAAAATIDRAEAAFGETDRKIPPSNALLLLSSSSLPRGENAASHLSAALVLQQHAVQSLRQGASPRAVAALHRAAAAAAERSLKAALQQLQDGHVLTEPAEEAMRNLLQLRMMRAGSAAVAAERSACLALLQHEWQHDLLAAVGARFASSEKAFADFIEPMGALQVAALSACQRECFAGAAAATAAASEESREDENVFAAAAIARHMRTLGSAARDCGALRHSRHWLLLAEKTLQCQLQQLQEKLSMHSLQRQSMQQQPVSQQPMDQQPLHHQDFPQVHALLCCDLFVTEWEVAKTLHAAGDVYRALHLARRLCQSSAWPFSFKQLLHTPPPATAAPSAQQPSSATAAAAVGFSVRRAEFLSALWEEEARKGFFSLAVAVAPFVSSVAPHQRLAQLLDKTMEALPVSASDLQGEDVLLQQQQQQLLLQRRRRLAADAVALYAHCLRDSNLPHAARTTGRLLSLWFSYGASVPQISLSIRRALASEEASAAAAAAEAAGGASPVEDELEVDVSFLGTGVTRPKVLKSVSLSGQVHREVCKQDDLRRDRVAEQLFALLNHAFAAAAASKDAAPAAALSLSTYAVIPFSPFCGVLEWVDDAVTLGEYLVGSGGGAAANRLLEAFEEVCRNFRPVLSHFFLEASPSASVWFARRLCYRRSLAAASIVGFVVGLGDRHLNNILLDRETGAFIHIDFGVMFDLGTLLPIPETVPFRLTRDILDALGCLGTEGPFKEDCCLALQLLRLNAPLVISVLEVLLLDPLYAWRKVDKTYRACMQVRSKLQGFDREGEAPLCIAAHVDRLLNTAQNPENLSRLFAGWMAWA